jgi:hypothetical protein
MALPGEIIRVEVANVRPEDIREHLQRRPFVPFWMALTDGRIYEVRHPDLVMVGRSSVVLGLPRPTETEPIYDRAVTVSLLHIMQIEPMETAAPPS